MVLNILLLAILFIAGLFNLFYYFPTKKFYAWFQSFFSATKSSTTATKSSLPCNKERNNINKKKLAELRRVFAMFDKNSDGFITKQELRESLKNMRIFMTDKEVEEIVMKADSNGDGLIDFEEFGMLSESMIGHDDHDHDQESTAAHINGNSFKEEEVGFDHELKEAFDVFDKDKDGLISVEELGSILSSMGLNEGNRIENCREMIKKVDMDGDGMVNFEEFKKMMKKSGGNNGATLLLSS